MRQNKKTDASRPVFLLFLLSSSCAAACTPGQYSIAGATPAVCYPCAAGTYCASTLGCLNNCTQCPPNSGSMAGASTCMGPFCQLCPPGYYCGGGLSIQGCPVGTYSSASSLYSSGQCLQCAAGTYEPVTGATACVNCSVGTYSPGASNTACLACSPGTYLTGSGFSACLLCTAGKFLTAQALNCTLCSPGTWQSAVGSSVCVLCGPGTYSTASAMVNASGCASCSPGAYSTELGRSAPCPLCAPGQYQGNPTATACVVCAIGAYATGNGSIACAQCPPLTSTLGNASTSLELHCLCNRGYTGPPSTCTPCAPGTFKNFSGNGSCVPCPPMTYDATTRVGDRTTPAICVSVPDNAYSPSGAAAFYCNAGYWFDTSDFTRPEGKCSQCLANTFSYANSIACTPCVNALSAAASTSITNCSCLPGALLMKHSFFALPQTNNINRLLQAHHLLHMHRLPPIPVLLPRRVRHTAPDLPPHVPDLY